MKKIFFLFLFLASVQTLFAQRSVAITIDDVPNTGLYQANHFKSLLQRKLDSLHIPVAIFINEGNMKQTTELEKNKDLLRSWLVKDYVTAGNHGFSHLNYGDVGFEAFKEDVINGEVLIKEYLKGTKKKLNYFRFPFNNLGNDSIAQIRAQKFLGSKSYIATPFTVESQDWLYAMVYDKALATNDKKLAKEIARQYIEFTLKLFSYFDNLSAKMYGHPVKQIYLCHDSKLNADYLDIIMDKLKKEKYKFISLSEAMTDPAYKNSGYYFGKDGFSWIYRWIKDPEKRKQAMSAQPSNQEIHKMFDDMNKAK